MLNKQEIELLYSFVADFKMNETCTKLIKGFLDGQIDKVSYYIICYIIKKMDLVNLEKINFSLTETKLTFNEILPYFENKKIAFKELSYFIIIKSNDFKIYCIDYSCIDNNPYKDYKEIDLEKLKKDINVR